MTTLDIDFLDDVKANLGAVMKLQNLFKQFENDDMRCVEKFQDAEPDILLGILKLDSPRLERHYQAKYREIKGRYDAKFGNRDNEVAVSRDSSLIRSKRRGVTTGRVHLSSAVYHEIEGGFEL